MNTIEAMAQLLKSASATTKIDTRKERARQNREVLRELNKLKRLQQIQAKYESVMAEAKAKSWTN